MEAEGTSFFIQECGLVNEVTEPGRKDTVTQNTGDGSAFQKP